MAQFTAQDGCKLFYQDLGTGTPAVFIHGWPLNSDLWEYQFNELPRHGIRCIGYDRRGFGRSDRPYGDYSYDTLASDLNDLLTEMNLTNVTLVGHSMGGGEVIRYLSKYGSQRVNKAVLIAAAAPYLMQDDSNPDGVPVEVFDELYANFRKDRPAALAAQGKAFHNVSLTHKPVSDEFLQADMMAAMMGAGHATAECIITFSRADFRNELASITIPVLIIHGEDDKVVPIKTSGAHLATMLPNNTYMPYEGTGHGLLYAKREQINRDLLTFITGGATTSAGSYVEGTSGYAMDGASMGAAGGYTPAAV